jgi:hypothetical protein
VSNELEGKWTGVVMAELGYCNSISLETLKKKTRNISHFSHYATQDSNQTSPELKLERTIIRTNMVGLLKKT